MPSVLIVDAYKSSLVMTSEVFKDKVLGIDLDIARSGEECIAMLNDKTDYDMLVVDFDLPDTDGICLVKYIRKEFSGPILLTAYLDSDINSAIQEELFPYTDVSKVVSKPVKADHLHAMINDFLIEGKRFRKRYASDLGAMLIGKGEGRGKRAPKVKGDVLNISIGGALLKLEDQCKMKIGEEVGLNLVIKEPKKSKVSKKSSKKVAKIDDKVVKAGVTKLKAKIAWADKSKKQAGVYFENLSDRHRKTLESILKSSVEL